MTKHDETGIASADSEALGETHTDEHTSGGTLGHIARPECRHRYRRVKQVTAVALP